VSEHGLSWETLDWSALDRLREKFLSGDASRESYWMSPGDLANYDYTYGQRIGWKWDAVLGELRLRGWTPPAGPLLDWGCGSGIAGRRVIECFGPAHFRTFRVFDRSSLAMDFAVEAARKTFPSLYVETPDQAWMDGKETISMLVVSHVLNELDEAGGRHLREIIERADAVLWVEPGTYADSRALIALREELREQFLLIAPCTHQSACGLLTTENERHWCHHFAAAPRGIMADANWVRFGRRAGIDLRSLPYSFLVLERKGLREPVPGLLAEGWSHIIGAPRVYKGFAKVLSCQADGVRELEWQKRDSPEVFKRWKDGKADPVYRWELSEGRIERVTDLQVQ
jgi:hypothetical protein